MSLSIDKAGDLKIGTRKCRFYKKDEIVKVARKRGVSNPTKKTIKQLCSSIRAKMKTKTSGSMTKDQAVRSIARMNISNYNKVKLGALFKERSPDHVVRVGRELARMR
jgi:thiazole synthase ThiGH ThiG subunit